MNYWLSSSLAIVSHRFRTDGIQQKNESIEFERFLSNELPNLLYSMDTGTMKIRILYDELLVAIKKIKTLKKAILTVSVSIQP
jgi:hypothetical protein